MPPRSLVLYFSPSLYLDLNFRLTLVLSNLLDCCPLLLLSNVRLNTQVQGHKAHSDYVEGDCDSITALEPYWVPLLLSLSLLLDKEGSTQLSLSRW